jgi:hypothetical protein
MPGSIPVIRTPDQRIRVFVSSTLRELQEERRAAREAIERMSLAPVMFELGARPHPPRELYRSYLAQSDVFVGIYWESYGWVAPDEHISGLEDEYLLAPDGMPKLIYIKASTDRDPRLKELIARIRPMTRPPTSPSRPPKSSATASSAISRRSSRSGSISRGRPTRSKRARPRPCAAASRCPTRRRSGASTTSTVCASCFEPARIAS